MNYLNLIPAAIIGSAAAAAVVALYFLKLRRTNQVVSSTLLWQKAIEDLKVNSPFQKLKTSLLLLLQILLLLLAAWALAQPTMWLQQREGKDIVFVLDNSASMNATDVPGGRLGQARSELIRMIENMARGDEARIILCGGSSEAPGSFTGSKEELHLIANAINPTDCRTELHEALSVALSLANMRIAQSEQLASNVKSVRSAEVHIFSDGCFPDVADLSRGKADVLFHPFGTATATNLAITHLDAQHIPGTTRSAVFAAVRNFSAVSLEAVLSLYNGVKLVDSKLIRLDPNKQTAVIFDNIPVVEATLQLQLEVDDDLKTDNEAWLCLRRPHDAKVLLVTPSNNFLAYALSMPGCKLDIVHPDKYSHSTDYDVVVFDRWAPQDLPDGNFLFFKAAPPPPFGPVGEMKTARTPIVTDVQEAHPVARYANLWELQPGECVQFVSEIEPEDPDKAQRFVLPTQAEVIVASDEGPLMWAISAPEGRILYVAFDTLYTYNKWPLRVSFPLFIANAVEWLSQGSGRYARARMRTGDIITLSVEQDVKTVEFDPPDGSSEDVVALRRRAAFGGTHKAGIYTVTPVGGEVPRHTVAVNLLDEQESDIKARKEWVLRGLPVPAGGEPGKVNREVWWWFALAAFGFLIFEWVVYHRRVFA